MPVPGSERETDLIWGMVTAAAANAEPLADAGDAVWCAPDPAGGLRPVPAGDPAAVLSWEPRTGWKMRLPADDPRSGLLDLYLPICSATAGRPITVGHLGLSLDGFIATPTGDSQFVTGHENILHLHRMRALCHAVVVGAGTVAADDPLLTTRHVTGLNPLRVVFDPSRRLTAEYRIFQDDDVPTWYCCGHGLIQPLETHVGRAQIVGVDDSEPGRAVADLLRTLHIRGCWRVFVEGGGVTVSAFLEANLLDHLQMAIAPLIIGDGRPAIRVPARATLSDCRRPKYRVFRMGGDVLFDCEFTADDSDDDGRRPDTPSVVRVI